MRALIIDYSNFTLEHDVFVVDTNTGEVLQKLTLPMQEICDFIKSDPEVEKVQIHALPEFGQKMEKEIKKDLALSYRTNNIEFEVVE